ncbi:G2/mitotic-specific cyclin-2-like isoform X2 [Nymphaea colorata]|uniref:G2/mitotic-specific cyclin-2-like isoform X2 n=1 Tax=Nymphaea colorata TaxID=210225 RepID=UPI00129EC20F|nr:G2/mitotic-specific cyclin-2-like isoform X2 [Nymphaea colorata]
MDWNDENSSVVVKPSNTRGEGAHRDRKALRDVTQFVGLPPLPPGNNKQRSPCNLKREVPNRPITRQLAALLANKRSGDQDFNQKKEWGKVLRLGPEDKKKAVNCDQGLQKSPIIEINNAESSYMEVDPCFHTIKYTVAILDEESDEESTFEKEQQNDDELNEVEMEDDINIDQIDAQNPLAVVDYVEEIYAFHRQRENSSCICSNYIARQPDINERMRAILVDWLIEVHSRFNLMDETLFLTVNILDRFLQRRTIMRKNLQLVGLTAMLVACKYEEVLVPVINDFILISDNAYSREQVLGMEKLIINTLEFNFSEPTPYVFLRRFLKAVQSEKKIEYLSCYLSELSLVDYGMLKYRPSMVAAAAVYSAQCMIKGFKCWSRTSEHHSRYSEDDILECARILVHLHKKAGSGKLTGVYRKYNTLRFDFSATTAPAFFLLDQCS